jgi:hypothetical protein
MTTTATPSRRRRAWRSTGLPVLLGWLVLAGPGAPARAQDFTGIDWGRSPILPPDLNRGFLEAPSPLPAPGSRPHRVRLLYMQPGFLSETAGLGDPDDSPLTGAPRLPEPDDGSDWISVSYGHDNPYFDIRQPGDPGGVGYYRVDTQVQLFDTRTTACCVSLRAVTPAGLQFDGLPDRQGPTVVTPSLSFFHALEDGTAFQTFLGKHLPVEQAGTAPVRKDLRYGMAVQRPLFSDPTTPLSAFYLSVGALGQYRMTDTPGPPLAWEVLPGFSWKVADNWWLSGAMIVPVGGGTRDNAGRWQFFCKIQF